jgi:glycyl-tRNA synthetase beta chain
MKAPLLIEIGCEELPARLIDKQLELLVKGLGQRLVDAGLIAGTDGIERFGTPRRLAICIPDVSARQADQVLERKGPAVDVAFDAEGNPTRAAEGFARSVGKSVDELERIENEQGSWLFARVEQPGQDLTDLLPGMFASTVESMAGARSMRWSNREERFLRPVRWLVVLHGSDVVPLEYFGLQASRNTRGHRIHASGDHELASAGDYADVLEKAFVLADPGTRRDRIRRQAETLANDAGLQVLIDDDLLDEVAGLTEWPVAVMGGFNEAFLDVPEQALISSMEQHQKCFALRTSDGELAARFIAVANIDSRDPSAMTRGFERVIHPRLADARFFRDQDRRTSLADKRRRLDGILFQEKLGSVGDKVTRIGRLAEAFAPAFNADAGVCARVAELCKCDLVTEMVGEFPELQGVMGKYYALADGENKAVAEAIESHYLPRQAGDNLPGDAVGQVVAVADRLDTLVGVFAAGQKPKGGKDPFALRRAALGVIRILDATDCPCPLHELIDQAATVLSDQMNIPDDLSEQVEGFIMERLRPWATESGIETNTVHAVAAGRAGSIADFMARARAVQQFADDPAVASLIAANKRASNLLKQTEMTNFGEVDEKSLQVEEEKRLFKAMEEAGHRLEQHLDQADYPAALAELAELREPVDRFFDEVMVMSDDEALKRNRLALLDTLRRLFGRIADMARLGR